MSHTDRFDGFPSRWLSALLLPLVLLAAFSHASNTPFNDPQTNVPGGIYVWNIPSGATTITFQERPVFVLDDYAIVAIPMSQAPGQAALQYTLNDQVQTHSFNISDKQYTEQHIELENQALVTPPPEVRDRISRELQRQRALYREHTVAPALERGFTMPLEGIVTSLFGHRRFFNGKPRSPHSGLDIAAPSGTPIIAAAGGKVTLADDLYFNGNTIFVDHGRGLITMYCHMSELNVKEGDVVAQGDVIGLVGSTGRSTGPHLHWSVSLAGHRVDPQTFTRVLNNITASLAAPEAVQSKATEAASIEN